MKNKKIKIFRIRDFGSVVWKLENFWIPAKLCIWKILIFSENLNFSHFQQISKKIKLSEEISLKIYKIQIFQNQNFGLFFGFSMDTFFKIYEKRDFGASFEVENLFFFQKIEWKEPEKGENGCPKCSYLLHLPSE